MHDIRTNALLSSSEDDKDATLLLFAVPRIGTSAFSNQGPAFIRVASQCLWPSNRAMILRRKCRGAQAFEAQVMNEIPKSAVRCKPIRMPKPWAADGSWATSGSQTDEGRLDPFQVL